MYNSRLYFFFSKLLLLLVLVLCYFVLCIALTNWSAANTAVRSTDTEDSNDHSRFVLKHDKVREPNCKVLFTEDQEEIEFTKQMLFSENRRRAEDKDYSTMAGNCSKFIQRRTYPMQPFSEEEEDFPLAYILTVHKNSEQVERLLRAVYAPQNVYCIHVDTKAAQSFQDAISAIANCLPNVFLVSEAVDIVYAGYSRLQADINCMKDLVNSAYKWKYAINVCGQDFPLKTNLETVKCLKLLDGKNDIPGVIPPNQMFLDRYQYKFEVVDMNGVSTIKKTKERYRPPPYNFTIHLGNAYNFFSRDFVGFVVKDRKAINLLKWMKNVYSPDEFYWATLQFTPETPGGLLSPSWGSHSRVIKWKFFVPQKYPECTGYYQRSVCVFGVGELRWLSIHPNFIANKFDLDFDHVAVGCLEKMLNERIEQQLRTS